jgi:hypothetical protein
MLYNSHLTRFNGMEATGNKRKTDDSGKQDNRTDNAELLHLRPVKAPRDKTCADEKQNNENCV